MINYKRIARLNLTSTYTSIAIKIASIKRKTSPLPTTTSTLNNFNQQEKEHVQQRQQQQYIQQQQYSEATVASQQLLTVVQTERRAETTRETSEESTKTIAAAAAAAKKEETTVTKLSITATTIISTDSLLTNSKANASVSPNSNLLASTDPSPAPTLSIEAAEVSKPTTTIEATVGARTTGNFVNKQKKTINTVASRVTNVSTATTSSASPVYSCSSASSSLIAQPPPPKIFKTDHLCVNPASAYGLPTVAAAAAVGHPCVYCVIPVPVVSTYTIHFPVSLSALVNYGCILGCIFYISFKLKFLVKITNFSLLPNISYGKVILAFNWNALTEIRIHFEL